MLIAKAVMAIVAFFGFRAAFQLFAKASDMFPKDKEGYFRNVFLAIIGILASLALVALIFLM